MANIRTIRSRIRSVQNTAKVTRAMEMIAASKMRRAQLRLIAGRPYADTISDVMAHLAAQVGDSSEHDHPLMNNRDVKKIQIIHITTDRGLCGGLNGNLNRFVGKFVMDQDVPVDVVPVGRKGRAFATRSGMNVRAVFMDIGDTPTLMDTLAISRVAIEDYQNGLVDEVYVSYSRFVSTVVQRPTIQKLLPVARGEVTPETVSGYIYEPDAGNVLEKLLPRFVEVEVFHAILESIGSEQSARMVAMSSASDSANEMIQDLTLLMNKVRQTSITTELLDIVGGVAALEG